MKPGDVVMITQFHPRCYVRVPALAVLTAPYRCDIFPEFWNEDVATERPQPYKDWALNSGDRWEPVDVDELSDEMLASYMRWALTNDRTD